MNKDIGKFDTDYMMNKIVDCPGHTDQMIAYAALRSPRLDTAAMLPLKGKPLNVGAGQDFTIDSLSMLTPKGLDGKHDIKRIVIMEEVNGMTQMDRLLMQMADTVLQNRKVKMTERFMNAFTLQTGYETQTSGTFIMDTMGSAYINKDMLEDILKEVCKPNCLKSLKYRYTPIDIV